MIYMTHPQHGAMHVYSEPEAVANERNGWTREKTASEATPIVLEIIDEIKVDDAIIKPSILPVTLSEQYEAKFGKKPHHKMSQKTIEAAMKE